MSYTDSQMRAFTQVAYSDLKKGYDYLCSKSNGQKSFSISAVKEATMMLDKNADLSSLNCLTEEQLNTWCISGVHDTNSTNGFYACIIETSPGEAVVGFRGSEAMNDASNMINDWVRADLGLLNSTCTSQQAEAERFLNKYKDQLNSYDSITMTGHSLGGNLAEYATIVSDKYGLDDNITQCVSMDGPGFSQEFIFSHKDRIKSMSGVMKHYRWSFVGGLLFDLPGVSYSYVVVTEEGNRRSVYRHDTKYLMYDQNGNLIESEQDSLAQVASVLSKSVDSLPREIGNIIKYGLGSLMIAYSLFVDENGIINQCKNLFSQICAGIESLKHFDIEKFIRKLTGGNYNYIKVDTSRLTNDVNSVIDMLARVNKNINEMYDEVVALNGMWTGPANIAFTQKFQEDYNEVKEYLKDVNNYVKSLAQKSESYNMCENTAISMAESIYV